MQKLVKLMIVNSFNCKMDNKVKAFAFKLQTKLKQSAYVIAIQPVTLLQIKFIMSEIAVKDYYKVLGISHQASSLDIQKAYQTMITEWHPARHRQNKPYAEMKFNEINEAFQVLYNKNIRSHYDELFNKQYSLADAQKSFNNFFRQNQLINQQQRKFFQQLIFKRSKKCSNHYQTLGLSNKATFEQIKLAYRKLAIKYHPRNNVGNSDQVKRFIQVNEAYQILSNLKKRSSYQKVLMQNFDQSRSQQTFQKYFGIKGFDFNSDIGGLEPTIKKKWSRGMNNLMNGDRLPFSIGNGQTYKQSTVFTRQNGVEVRKTIKQKITSQDSQRLQIKIDQYSYPNGEKSLTKVVTENGNSTTTAYHIKHGQQIPRDLML